MSDSTHPSASSATHSPAAWARFLLTAAIGLALDQWTKIHAVAHLASAKWTDNQGRVRFTSATYHFIPQLLDFHVTANEGAVFGFGQGRRVLFVLVSVAAIIFVGYLFATSGRQRLYQIVLGMLVAGILGNLYDRIALGYVRDMIWAFPDWGVFPWIFNIADSLLCVGVGAMIVYSFFNAPAKSNSTEAAPKPQ